MAEATESITTSEDGDTTVNERLSTGGPGPEGQPDTVTERLSGPDRPAPETAAVKDDSEPAEPEPSPKPRKRS